MQWSDFSFTPASRTLRQFALIWLIFFSGLACWNGLVRDRMVLALVFAGLAVAVGPVGLLRPQAIRWVFLAAQLVAFPIGWVVSRVSLALLFYAMFTPVGLVFRVLGRDPLGKQPRPDQPTYWTAKPAAAGPQSYLNQY
jgi:hypothetical protein